MSIKTDFLNSKKCEFISTVALVCISLNGLRSHTPVKIKFASESSDLEEVNQ